MTRTWWALWLTFHAKYGAKTNWSRHDDQYGALKRGTRMSHAHGTESAHRI